MVVPGPSHAIRCRSPGSTTQWTHSMQQGRPPGRCLAWTSLGWLRPRSRPSPSGGGKLLVAPGQRLGSSSREVFVNLPPGVGVEATKVASGDSNRLGSRLRLGLNGLWDHFLPSGREVLVDLPPGVGVEATSRQWRQQQAGQPPWTPGPSLLHSPWMAAGPQAAVGPSPLPAPPLPPSVQPIGHGHSQRPTHWLAAGAAP
jgi:hypothetical protein